MFILLILFIFGSYLGWIVCIMGVIVAVLRELEAWHFGIGIGIEGCCVMCGLCSRNYALFRAGLRLLLFWVVCNAEPKGISKGNNLYWKVRLSFCESACLSLLFGYINVDYILNFRCWKACFYLLYILN